MNTCTGSRTASKRALTPVRSIGAAIVILTATLARAESWKFAEIAINPDASFTITLENEEARPVFGSPSGFQATQTIIVPQEGHIIAITYDHQGVPRHSNDLHVDTSNANDIGGLRTLAKSAEQWMLDYKRRPGLPPIAPMKQFTGLDGVFKVRYDENNSKQYALITLQQSSASSDRLGRSIQLREPGAVLFLLDHISELPALCSQAVKSRDEAAALKKQQQQQQVEQDLANARVASEQRIKDFRAKEEARVLGAKKQTELEQLSKEEEKQKGAIRDELQQEKRRRIATFLASEHGSALSTQIKKLQASVYEQDNKERRYLSDLQGEFIKYSKVVAPTPAMELARERALSAWLTAQMQHKESADLVQKKMQLEGLLAVYKRESGFEFSEAQDQK